MRRWVLVTLTAGLALGLGATATATTMLAERPEAPTSVISLEGLDLSNPYDADRMLNRIEAASRVACGVSLQPRPLAERQAAERCVHAAMGGAVRQLNHPQITARFEERGEPMLVVAMN